MWPLDKSVTWLYWWWYLILARKTKSFKSMHFNLSDSKATEINDSVFRRISAFLQLCHAPYGLVSKVTLSYVGDWQFNSSSGYHKVTKNKPRASDHLKLKLSLKLKWLNFYFIPHKFHILATITRISVQTRTLDLCRRGLDEIAKSLMSFLEKGQKYFNLSSNLQRKQKRKIIRGVKNL